MIVDLTVRAPDVPLATAAAAASEPLPEGHWWDGSDELRAECGGFQARLHDVDAQLADAGAALLHGELLAHKARAEKVLRIDKQLRDATRFLPRELPLMTATLPDGLWERNGDTVSARARTKDAAEAAKELTTLSAADVKVTADGVAWSYPAPK